MAMERAQPTIDVNSAASWMYISRSGKVIDALAVGGPPTGSRDPDSQYRTSMLVPSYADAKSHHSVQ